MKCKLLRQLKSMYRYVLFGVLMQCCVGSMLLANVENAPSITVTGTVTSQTDGEGLPGVSILVKGTSTGTVTDIEGKYSINVPNENDVLVFSSIGYITQEVPVNGRTTVDVTMAEDVQSLEEVVVVGYGSQKKSDLTGAVSSVKAEEITQLPMQRVDQALQGRATGVYVLNTDGSPGGNTTIRIRGMNSIHGGNNALIVIDGLQGGNLNALNPNDIESIEILKDASATAIYGSQGANGVILVTTKGGKKGKPVINYSYNYGIQNILNKLDVMDAADYARTINDVRATRNRSGVALAPIFSDAEIEAFEANGGTDWQDVIFRAAPIQNHQLSIGGGTDNLKYMVSGGYLDHEGILVNSAYKRFSLRANLQTDINNWASFGLNWAGSRESGNAPPFGSADGSFLGQPIAVAPRWAPTTPVYDADGNYNLHPMEYGPSDTWNPLASAKEPSIENITNMNTFNAYLDFKILEGLSLKVTGGAITRNRNNRSYYNLNTYEGKQKNGSGITSEELFTRLQNSNILTYNKQFNEIHNLTVTGVAEQQYERVDGSRANSSNYLVDQTGIYDLGGANIVVNSSYANERVINSYLGRINYSFRDKYLITASYRADGSSVFGKNNKWGYFPSMSAAWRISEESFIKDLNLFSQLKLRGSWGATGNQAISPYETLARISSGSNYPYNGGATTDLGFYVSAASNPSLRWETTTQTNFGIDFGFYDERLLATVDYYKKTTEDLLMPRDVPRYTGLASVIDNVGSIENRGLEVSISGDPIVGAFHWNSSLNISGNRNKVIDLGNNDRIAFGTTKGGYSISAPFMYLVEGEPFGQMYGWGTEGTWKESEVEQAAKYGQLPGDQRYTDVDRNDTIDVRDFKVIGNSFPDFIFGWSNRMSYKGFELTFLIQGTKGNDIFNQSRIRLENPGEGTSTRLLDRWTPQNQDTDVPALIDELTRQNANLTSTILAVDQRISRWIEDGSYIRLKNVTLAYNLPGSVTERMKIGSLRTYISGTNLITLTKYTGFDPEVSAWNSNDAQIGVDFGNYPSARTFTFGIDISF